MTTEKTLSRSESLAERATRVLPRGNSRATLYIPPAPPYAVRGQGAVVTDADGHQVIDCSNNYTSLIHGHAHPAVTAAAVGAAQSGSAFGLPVEGEITLAEMLSSRFGRPLLWRFSNSGSEAVMMAIRAARAFTGRELVVRVAGNYHGTYDQVVAPKEPGVSDSAKQGTIVLPQEDEEALREVFRLHGERIAAILVDLMPNRAGLRPVPPSFVTAMRGAAAEAGALVIVDEIITYRLGLAGLQESYGLEADITTVAKIIGGGFPVGGVGARAEVMDCFDPTRPQPIHWGGTFSANPVTMAAGAACLANYGPEEIAALNRRGDLLRERLAGAGLEVTGRGSLLRVFPSDGVSAWWELYRRGVLVAGNGLVVLSTAMTDEQIDTVGATIIDVLS